MKFLHLAGLKNRIQHYEIYDTIPGGNGQIHVAAYPLHLFPGKLALKMAHHKMLIVDGDEAVIGGMNFASITEKNHDVMVAVRGPIVVEMGKYFELDWQLAIEKNDLKYHLRNQITENASLAEGIQFLVTAPYLRNARTFLLDQIRTVRKRILLEMYLLSDNEILNALIVAKRRGIEIKVILDANRLPLELDLHGFPNKRAVEVLIKNGIPLKIFRSPWGSEMHLKMALFDDQKIFIGSCNWTYGSFTFNSEGSFFINSRVVFPKFLRIFEEDWSEKSDYPQELTPRERILCRVARLLQHYY
jgi:phosphatidylserine/phosphatidylglycerophosphate/cardiolipin synthase-like enzyme